MAKTMIFSKKQTDTSKMAVVETGGKQYLVSVGDKIKIEKIEGEEGSKAVFDKVLLAIDNDKVNVGNPYINGVKIEGTIIKQGRLEKVSVIKFKAKVRYHKKYGHRQPFTEVEIIKI